MVGGIVAAAILDGLTPGPLAVSVGLGQGTNRTQGLFIGKYRTQRYLAISLQTKALLLTDAEMFTTAALTMSVLMLAAGELH